MPERSPRRGGGGDAEGAPDPGADRTLPRPRAGRGQPHPGLHTRGPRPGQELAQGLMDKDLALLIVGIVVTLALAVAIGLTLCP
jgi:hypothetical protein